MSEEKGYAFLLTVLPYSNLTLIVYAGIQLLLV